MGVIEYTFRLKLMTVATADDSADSLCCHRILVASPRGVLA